MPETVFSIAASADDTNLFRTGVTYPPSTTDGGNQNANTFLDVRKSTGFETHIMFLKFNTSSLPDAATVTGASLKLYADSKASADARDVNFEWYTWTTPAHPTDWADVVGTTAAVVTVASITTGAVNTIALSSPGENVNKTGNTTLRFGLSGGQPTGSNEIFFIAFDHATLVEPQLVVYYALPPDYSQFPKAKLRPPTRARW